jgi:hypothetical protein
MQTINELRPIPNQEFNVTIGDHDYAFKFMYCGDFMAYDLSIDEVEVITGFRMVYGQPLITYRYQEVDGNFIIDTNGINPIYTEFNTTQFLRYLTSDESDSWRNLIMTGSYD